MPVFLLRFQASPLTDRSAGDVGGAFINCWVQRDTMADADETARKLITDQGWIITEEVEAAEVRREQVDEESGLEYFEQCLIDGEVAVFYSYPIEDEEETSEE